MTINTYLPTIESKNKLSKQEEQRQSHGYGEHFDGCKTEGGCEGKDEEVRELKSTNGWLQNTHGNARYIIGNGVAKKLNTWPEDMNNGVGVA